MTAVVTFRVGAGAPIIIGDVLLSGVPNPDVSTPSVHLPNQRAYVGSGQARVAGMCQKVEIISDQLCVAWAGWAIEAYGFIISLKREFRNKTVTWGVFRAFVEKLEAIRGITFVAYFWDGKDFGSADNHASYHLGDLTDVRIFGSGTESLFPLLANISADVSEGRYSGAPQNQGITLGLVFAGYALGRQVFQGFGVVEGWGGMFEMAFFEASTRRFMKSPSNLHIFFDCLEQENGELRVTLMRPFIYQWYRDEFLLSKVSLGKDSGPNRVFAIGSFGEPIPDDVFDSLPTNYKAASLIASIRHRNGETERFGVRVWTGRFSDCPIRIYDLDESTNRAEVSNKYVAEIGRLLVGDDREFNFYMEM